MRVIHSARDLGAEGKAVCLAMGFFDGVHLGHQRIIKETIQAARTVSGMAVVLSFDRHPNTIVAPDRVPLLIQSLPQKLKAISRYGPDATLLLHFDTAFSRQAADVFVRTLAHDLCRLHAIYVGSNFAFGHRRAGNLSLLFALGAECGFSAHGITPVMLDGAVVSSTNIRQSIAAGDFAQASAMLGRTYTLRAPVIRGDALGRQLGFPTANLDVTGLVLPPFGVYAARVIVGGSETVFRAVANIGVRPTLKQPVPQLRVEAHLLEFDGDLYGHEVELEFGEKLRDEKKFSSLAQLQQQIAEDVQQALASKC